MNFKEVHFPPISRGICLSTSLSSLSTTTPRSSSSSSSSSWSSSSSSPVTRQSQLTLTNDKAKNIPSAPSYIHRSRSWSTPTHQLIVWYCTIITKKQYIHIISQSNPTTNKCQHWFYWYIGISTNTCPIFRWWPGAPPWSTAQTWSHKWVNGNMLEMAVGLFILIASRFPGAFLRRRFPLQFQPLTVAQWDSLVGSEPLWYDISPSNEPREGVPRWEIWSKSIYYKDLRFSVNVMPNVSMFFCVPFSQPSRTDGNDTPTVCKETEFLMNDGTHRLSEVNLNKLVLSTY